MQEYVIMTDSCCDLTAYMAHELALEVLPLTLHMADQQYPSDLEGSYISHEAFYRCIRQGKLASTSGVNVGQYQDAMRPILEQGKDIVCIAFSSALSTTYQSAVIAADDLAKEFPERKIYVIDSLCASLGQGLLIYLAAREKQKGLSAAELADWVEQTKHNICHWFTVDDLNHLKRGGRISATSAMLGTMLAIKPVMHMSPEGKLVPVGKARGRKASLKALLDAVERLAIVPREQTMFICHGDCEEEARWVAEQLKERFGVKTVYINYIGPVIGSHAGPNTIGLFFVGTER